MPAPAREPKPKAKAKPASKPKAGLDNQISLELGQPSISHISPWGCPNKSKLQIITCVQSNHYNQIESVGKWFESNISHLPLFLVGSPWKSNCFFCMWHHVALCASPGRVPHGPLPKLSEVWDRGAGRAAPRQAGQGALGNGSQNVPSSECQATNLIHCHGNNKQSEE